MATLSPRDFVFIVDDEALLAQLAETLLKDAGFRTRSFLDPQDALRAIRDDGERPALLVTDYVMGSMTGLELIEECLKYHPALRTLLMSGTVTENFLEQFQIQPDFFLPKPYKPARFIETVAQTLQRA